MAGPVGDAPVFAGPARGGPSIAVVRVVVVIDSLAQGGAEASTTALAPLLVRRGVELEVVLLDDRRHDTAALAAAGVPVRVVGRGPRGWRRLAGLVRGADLVHTSLWAAHQYGRTAARRTGVPVVSSWTGTPYGPGWFGGRPRRRIGRGAAFVVDRLTARVVRRFHAPAEHVAATMSERLGVDRDRVDVVPRGRDPVRFAVRDPSLDPHGRRSLAPFPVAPDRPLVVVVARHEPDKGIARALEAVARTRRSLTVVVAGREGTQTALLRRRASELAPLVDVRLVGVTDRVPELLAAADLLVLASEREGLPGALVEALAVTTPVVAQDLPGVREVLGDTLGSLVPPGDTDALAAAVSRALDGDIRWDPTAARRRFEERFSLPGVADLTVAAYRRAVGDRTRGRR